MAMDECGCFEEWERRIGEPPHGEGEIPDAAFVELASEILSMYDEEEAERCT
jgi:hypothetical protein